MLSGMRTSTGKGSVVTVLCSMSSVVRIAFWCVLVGMVLGIAIGYQAASPTPSPSPSKGAASLAVTAISGNGGRCVDHADPCDRQPPRRVAAVVRALN
jgi:hypothetical protein